MDIIIIIIILAVMTEFADCLWWTGQKEIEKMPALLSRLNMTELNLFHKPVIFSQMLPRRSASKIKLWLGWRSYELFLNLLAFSNLSQIRIFLIKCSSAGFRLFARIFFDVASDVFFTFVRYHWEWPDSHVKINLSS